MSNVLIGIIGVILFIGLALAGAIFLGERFAQSRNTSIGAATVQAVDQVSNGINLYNTENGSPMRAGTAPAALTPGYLKSVPANPTGTGGTASAILTSAGDASGGDGRLVVMKLGGAALDACKAITRQTAGGQDTIGQNGVIEASTAAELPRGPAGCFFVKAGFGALDTGSYYAFSRP